MVKNNAHNSETASQRLLRFQNNGPVETIETLLNSLDNHFNNEIRVTPANFQTTLLFLGIHAVALTIGEVFFNNLNSRGRTDHFKNYKDFLEKFVDGLTDDTKFSTVSDRIHKWRNVIAHQWISISGHGIAYDYDMRLGWIEVDGILVINPRIYCNTYLQAFKAGGKIWKYNSMFTPQELNDIHARILAKYQAQ